MNDFRIYNNVIQIITLQTKLYLIKLRDLVEKKI